MDKVEQAVRALGHAIQADPRYQAFHEAKAANDADVALQAAIASYQQKELTYQQELQRSEENPNDPELQQLAQEVQREYAIIVQNPHMQTFDAAKRQLDDMIKRTQTILHLCVNGEDPDTCTPDSSACSGNCHSCGGCGTNAEIV